MRMMRHLSTALAAVLTLTYTDALAQSGAFRTSGLATQQLQVEGKALVTAVTGTCPAVVLTVNGIPVNVTATTTFPAGQSCGQLAVNQQVEIRGTLTVTGTTLSVVATMVEIEDGTETEGEGRVTAVTGTCPNLTITVDGLTVAADALTRYFPANRGAGCDQIRVGTRIKAKTVPVAGGGLRARTIDIKGQRHFGEGEGRITSVSGTCPNVTIMLGTTPVTVNAATDFVGGTCGELASGVRVQARGFRDDDSTTNIASWVRFKSRRVEGRATVTAVSGSCPVIGFTVAGSVRVVTDASTVFRGGSCQSIRVGVRVKVKGDMRTDDGEVIAEEVDIEGQPGGRNGGRIEGSIQTLTGTCPALTMTVRGVTVTTSAATQFDDVTCAALTIGTRVEVEGDLQGTTLVATKIERED